MAKDKGKDTAPPTTKKAVLDDDDVLVRYESHDYPEGVDVPIECDLELGRYRWDGQKFNPLPKDRTQFTSEVAAEVRGVIAQLVDQGIVTPTDRLTVWLKEGR